MACAPSSTTDGADDEVAVESSARCAERCERDVECALRDVDPRTAGREGRSAYVQGMCRAVSDCRRSLPSSIGRASMMRTWIRLPSECA